MKTFYESTRNNSEQMSSSEAIIKGISQDGGLYVLGDFNKHPLTLTQIKNKSYMEIAKSIFKIFFHDFSESQIEDALFDAYSIKFKDPAITPLVKSDTHYILELFHGPTQAFKDVALSILPSLMNQSLTIQKFNKEIMILTATSGDTGKAALEGFKDKDNMNIIVFYPHDGVSPIQELQMTTQEGSNVHVSAIHGNFDDAQRTVKELFLDVDLRTLSSKFSYQLSSANSVNIGRLIPQIVYYFDAYKQLLQSQEIEEGELVNFVVPTGNFGNILAGYLAKHLGLPVHKLISASNENKVVHDFISTGTYDIRRPFIKTTSPSMDILVSSNLERLLYYVSGQDNDFVKKCMHQLDSEGSYTISQEILATIQKDFMSGYASDEEVLKTIQTVYQESSYLLDPHTAVAYKVMRDLEPSPYKSVVLATASPFKFPRTVAKAIELNVDSLSDFEVIDLLSKVTNSPIPEELVELKNKEVIHKSVLNKDAMKSYVISKVGSHHD